MAGGVQDAKVPDHVPLFYDDLRDFYRRTRTKMHREAPGIVKESRGIQFMDRDLCLAHVGDLFDVRCVIEMAVGEYHRRYGILVGS